MRWRLLAAPASAVIVLAAAGCDNKAAANDQAKPAAAAQPAGGINDPVNFTLAAYGRYANSPDKPSTDVIRYSQKPEFSPRLRSYFALDEKEAGGEVGRLNSDIYTGTQDGRIRDVEVEAKDVELAKGQRMVMIVTFINETTPTEMRLYFEKIGTKWFLDDIASMKDSRPDGNPPWTLSNVLKYGW